MKQSIIELYGAMPGETVWVLGNGPALAQAPCPVPGTAIGVNRILQKGHTPRYLLLVDLDIWNGERQRILDARPSLIMTQKLLAQIPMVDTCDLDVHLFRYDLSVPPGRARVDVLHRGYLTGYYAAEIAAYMVWPGGTVVLAGMDLRDYPGGFRHPRFPQGIEALVKLRGSVHKSVNLCVAGDSELLAHDFPAFSC